MLESKSNYKDLDEESKSNLNYYLGNIHRILRKHNDSAIYYSLKSLNYFEKNNINNNTKTKLLKNLANLYEKINNQSKNYYYLKKYISDLSQKEDSTNLAYAYNNLGSCFSALNNVDSSLFYFKKAIKTNKKSKIKGSIQQNIGAVYLGRLNNIDSAEYFFNKALKNKISNKGLSSLFFNKAVISKIKGNNKEAIYFYLKASKYADSTNNIEMKSYVFEDLSNLFEVNKDYKRALNFRKEFQKLTDSLKNINLLEKIEEYDIKYDSEKKGHENSLLKANIEKEQQQKMNLFIGALIFILFGGITAFLIQKNTRKKQKLAEQEKALETQKLATVLKEQELLSIDAMIEGQEKERQRIANDLHDDLGGLMATVKLHFNALKEKQTPELYSKTNTLIDEAYQKIRSIAHAKNSGVIAKQGLLKAITEMADKISALNKIKIDVIDHGLENRLENSLELTIFRIVQELITNIIKHAHATEATIHITNHDDSLNIMVEDNGKGFNPSQITKTKKGMGISSIDKRVEHLNGNMTIESEKNQGTTIIIDIPV